MNKEHEPEMFPYTKTAFKITTMVSIAVYFGIIGVHCYNRIFEDVPVQQEQVAPNQLELKTVASLYVPLDSLYVSSHKDATLVE